MTNIDIANRGGTVSHSRSARVLVVGRSPSVLVDAVDRLRDKGYVADATNQFDRVLTDYDATGLDIVVFGGMVPSDLKQHLREQIAQLNPEVVLLQGLAGIAGVITAQVEAVAAPAGSDRVVYDEVERTLSVTLDQPARVTIEAWWATSFTPPEPSSSSMIVRDDDLPAGHHVIDLPDQVPAVASYAAVRIGDTVEVLTIGAMPAAVAGMVPTSSGDRRLPSVAAVSTRTDG